jgi:hypothetical protein
MTVVLTRETTKAMTVVTQDKITGAVAVTVIQDVVDEMTGDEMTEAVTLVGKIPGMMTEAVTLVEEEDLMMTSPSSLH